MNTWGNEILVDVDREDFDGYTVRIEDDEPFSFRADYHTITVRHAMNWAMAKGDMINLALPKFRVRGVIGEILRKANPDRWEVTIYNEEYLLDKTVESIRGFIRPSMLKSEIASQSMTIESLLIDLNNTATDNEAVVDTMSLDTVNLITINNTMTVRRQDFSETIPRRGFYTASDETDRKIFVLCNYEEGDTQDAIGYSYNFDTLELTEVDLPTRRIQKKARVTPPTSYNFASGGDTQIILKYYRDIIESRIPTRFNSVEWQQPKIAEIYYDLESDTLIVFAVYSGRSGSDMGSIFIFRNICTNPIDKFYYQHEGVSYVEIVRDVCFLTDSIYRLKEGILTIRGRATYPETVDISADASLMGKGFPEQTHLDIDEMNYSPTVISLPQKYVDYRNDYYNAKAKPFKSEFEVPNTGIYAGIDLLDKIVAGDYEFGTTLSKTYDNLGSLVTFETRKQTDNPDYWRRQ